MMGFWEWDLLEDRLTYCSEGYARILGKTRAECIAEFADSKKDWHAVHPLDRQRYIDAEEQVYADGNAGSAGLDIEYRIIDAHGDTRYIHEISETIRNEAGQAVRSSGTIQDITEHKAAADLLRESESKSRAWLEHSPACTKIVDLDFNLQYMSKAGTQALGIDDISRFYGKPYPFDFYPQSFIDEMIGNLKRVRETGEIVVQEAAVVDLEGNEVWFHSTLVPVNDENGQIEYLIVVSIDITERKLLGEELIKMEKLESIGVLAGGIAHDLNNLLAAVVGNLSLARICEDTANKNRKIEEAEKASLLVEALARQLLTFSKGGSPVRQRVDLGKLLRGWVSFPLRGSSVTGEYSIAGDLWDVNIDEGQINQVVTNLIINAKQSMPQGGTVNVSAENILLKNDMIGTLAAGSYVKIVVRDAGEGIPRDILRQIFDPFFSSKKTGSGLGLATSHSIIKKHGGNISVDSKVGVGSAFTVYLPVATGAKLAQAIVKDAAPLLGEGSVLVMDDDQMIRDLAVASLTALGYRATTTKNDVETVEVYSEAMDSEDPFDLVILDLTIPGGPGGRDVIARIRKLDPRVKAIVCSGYSTDPVMANFSEYGFKASISKPYRIKELGETLHGVLGGS